jgi:hypothetical protein
MVVTKLNVLSIFADAYDAVNPCGKSTTLIFSLSSSFCACNLYSLSFFLVDVNLLFNYVWSVSQMNAGEAWTPLCMPGCSEEFMLHCYTCFRGDNLGMILMCTDHEADYFLECNEYRT